MPNDKQRRNLCLQIGLRRRTTREMTRKHCKLPEAHCKLRVSIGASRPGDSGLVKRNEAAVSLRDGGYNGCQTCDVLISLEQWEE